MSSRRYVTYLSPNTQYSELILTNLTELLSLNVLCRLTNEVTLVRMSNDATMEPAKRRNYTGVGNAFSRILREEGVKTFFTGSVTDLSPTLY